MGVRDTCPRCGRGGSGKQNLITRQDIETQAVYLDQRGYFFKNPYWNVTSVPKILPEPYLFEDIMGSDLRYKTKKQWGGEHTDGEKKELAKLVSDIGLAIKERKEEEEKKLKEKFIKLRKGHYIPGAIHKDVPASQYGSLKRYDCGELILYEFRYRWIYTSKILTHLPYSMRESLRESTFYLKPMNEQEFAPHALTERWEPRLRICGFEVNDGSKWEKLPDELFKEKYLHLKREEPSPDIINNFLIAPCYKIWEWREQYITSEDSRVWYKQEYLDDLKEFLKDFAINGKWGVDYEWDVKSKEGTPSKNEEVKREYEQMRVLMYAWGNVLVRHIEGRVDNTRQGYVCYLPGTFTTFSRAFDRVNDERLIFTMSEDQVASWYPRLFDVDNVIWQFVTRPMTKKMFEEFNEENIGGQKVKLPVQSCVFCPGGRGMSTSTNDDEPIVRPQTLIGVHQDGSAEWKDRVEKWKDRALRYAKLASAEEVSGLLDSICHDPKIVKNLEGRELENLQDIINKLRGGSYIQGLSGGATENLNQSEDIIKAELGRRDDEIQAQEDKKDFLEQQQQELENQRTEYENEKGIRIEELRENRAEINRKQNEIRNLNDTSKEIRKKIDDCDKSIRNTETLVGNLTSQVNQARTDANRATSRAEEERLRDYADKLQGELNTAQIQLNTHKSRLRELQTDFETNREAIYTVKKDIEELEKRNDLLNKQNKELDEEIKKTREKGKVNQNEIEKIKDDLREKPSGGDRGGRGGGTTEEPPKKTTGDISITLNLANDDYVFRAYSNTCATWERTIGDPWKSRSGGFLGMGGSETWTTSKLVSISLSIARAYRDCLAEKMSGFTYDYYNPSTEDDHGVYVDSHNNLTYGIKVTYFKWHSSRDAIHIHKTLKAIEFLKKAIEKAERGEDVNETHNI